MILPVAASIANMPPPASGFWRLMSDRERRRLLGPRRCPTGCRASVPPLPMRVCQTILPFWSGSNPCTTADFCPATSTCFPPPISSRTAEPPKSTSSPDSRDSCRRRRARPQPQLNMSGLRLAATSGSRRSHVDSDDGVGGLDVGIRVAVAGHDVNQLALEIQRGRRPDGRAGRAVELYAASCSSGGLRLRRSIRPPDDVAVSGLIATRLPRNCAARDSCGLAPAFSSCEAMGT